MSYIIIKTDNSEIFFENGKQKTYGASIYNSNAVIERIRKDNKWFYKILKNRYGDRTDGYIEYDGSVVLTKLISYLRKQKLEKLLS